MRDPFNLSKPPASNPEPIWIKQPLSYKMRDPFSLSKSRSLKSFTPQMSLPEASSLQSNKNMLGIRRNNKKGKTISSALPRWIAFHSASLRKNPNAPLALWPLGPVGAEGAVRARSAQRAPARARRSARPSARARAKRAPPAGSPQGPPRRRVPPHPGCEH